MHEALKDLQNHLEDLIEGLSVEYTERRAISELHTNDWSFPGCI